MSGQFPAPDRHRCPVCGAMLRSPRCETCGAELVGAEADEVWAIDLELHRLSQRRDTVVAHLRPDPPPPTTVDPRPTAGVGPVAGAGAAPDERPGWVRPPPSTGPREAWAAGATDLLPPPPTSAAPLPGWQQPMPPVGGGPAPSWSPGGPPIEPKPGPEVSSILLGLGTALLVVAALVFAAVSWSRLGALGQGALLVGLTGAVALATDRAVRRGLTGTAEALGVLTVVLGPLLAQAARITADLGAIDDRTWANWANWSWWPAALVLIGVAAIVFGRLVGVRSPQYLGIVLVQVGLPIWVALAPVATPWIVAVLALQAAVVAAGPGFTQRDRPTGDIWTAGSILVWMVAATVATVAAFGDNDTTAAHLGMVLSFAACAASAAATAWRWRDEVAGTDVVAGAATVAVLAGAGRAVAGTVPEVVWWPVMGAVSAAGIAVAAQLEASLGSPRSRTVRNVCWAAAAVASVPVVGAVVSALATATAMSDAWQRAAGDRVSVSGAYSFDLEWPTILAGFGVIGLAMLADRARLGRRIVELALVGLTALAILTVPVLAGTTLAVITVLTLAVAVGLAAVAWAVGDRRLVPGASVGAIGLGLSWASGTEALTLAALLVAIALGAVAIEAGRHADDTVLAGCGAVLASLAGAAEVGVVAWVLGADTAWTWAAVSMAAAAAGAALPAAGLGPVAAAAGGAPAQHGFGQPVPDAAGRPPPPSAGASVPTGFDSSEPDGHSAVPAGFVPSDPEAPAVIAGPGPVVVASRAAGAVLLASHLFAVGVVPSVGPGRSISAALTASLALGVMALAAIAARIRPTQGWWWLWAVASGTEAVVLVWTRLALADVGTVEAYSLPVAVLLAGTAWLVGRTRPGGPRAVSSWALEGPALAVALGPTALLALGDPGVVRQAVGLVAGAVLLTVGATWRRRAPIDVGAAAVVALGLQALLPYADDIPRWISLGTVGAVLVLLGATFEDRRRDLHEAKRRYASLR